MASAFNLIKLMVGLLLVVVLGGTAINVFYVNQLVMKKRQAIFGTGLGSPNSDRLKKILGEAWEMSPQIEGIPIGARDKSEKCLRIIKYKPRPPHRESSRSIKKEYSRAYRRWKENKKRECYKTTRK